MVIEGLKLMVIGMTIVYIFLIILMLLVILSARLLKRRSVSVSPASTAATGDQDSDLIAVISAAISRYRAGKK